MKSQVVAVTPPTRSSTDKRQPERHEERRKKSSRPYVIDSGNKKRDEQIEREVREAIEADEKKKKEKERKIQRERLQRELDRCLRVNTEVTGLAETAYRKEEVKEMREKDNKKDSDDGTCRVDLPSPSQYQKWGGPAEAAGQDNPPIVVNMAEDQLRDCKNVSIDEGEEPNDTIVTATFTDDSSLKYRPKDLERLEGYVKRHGGDPGNLADILTVAGFLVEREEEEARKKKQERKRRKEENEKARQEWQEEEPSTEDISIKRNSNLDSTV